MNIDEMVRGVNDALNVRRVYGDPVERDDLTVIPVAAVRGAGGGGGDESNNGGGGFVLRARPVGVYVLRDGGVEWRPAVDVQRLALAGVVALVFLAGVLGGRRSSGDGT